MQMSEPVLFDTNVLVAAADLDSSNHKIAKELHQKVEEGEIEAVIAHQNLEEFLAITTDPKRVKTPLSPTIALKEVEKYLFSRFRLISPKDDTIFIFVSLLRKKPAKAQRIFDVYLAATMLSSGVGTIYTENVGDFAKYSEIETINPFKR